MIALTLCVGGMPATPAPVALVAQAAPPELVSELSPAVERARQRFEARDAAGVLAHVSEQYRSGGLTKADLRQQLLAMFALYEVLRARVIIDNVQVVDGAAMGLHERRSVRSPAVPGLGACPHVAEQARGGAAA